MPEKENKPRTKSVKQLEEQLERARKREAKLKKELSKKKAQEKKMAKRWEDNAKIQIGGIALKYLGLNWRTLDPEKFEQQFKAISAVTYNSGKPIFDCARASLEPREAHNAWIEFQSAKQHEAALERKARANRKG